MTGESLAALCVQLGLKPRDAISMWRRFLLGFRIACEIVQPVIVAAHFDFVNFVLDELVHGCPADLHGPVGDNILFFAARADAFQNTIEKGADINQRTNDKGTTPLHAAIKNDISLRKAFYHRHESLNRFGKYSGTNGIAANTERAYSAA